MLYPFSKLISIDIYLKLNQNSMFQYRYGKFFYNIIVYFYLNIFISLEPKLLNAVPVHRHFIVISLLSLPKKTNAKAVAMLQAEKLCGLKAADIMVPADYEYFPLNDPWIIPPCHSLIYNISGGRCSELARFGCINTDYSITKCDYVETLFAGDFINHHNYVCVRLKI